MTPVTKDKTRPTAAAKITTGMQAANKVAGEMQARLEAFDALCLAIARGQAERDLDFEALATSLNLSKLDVERALARTASVARHQEQFGSWEQLRADEAAAAKASAALAKAAPGIQEQIEQLQRQLSTLEGDVAVAQARLHKRQQAAANLRSLDSQPPWLQSWYGKIITRINGSPAAVELRTLEQRCRMILGVQAIEPHDKSAQAFHLDAVHGGNHAPFSITSEQWAGHVRTLVGELPSLEARIGELRAIVSQQKADAGQLLDRYLDSTD